MNFICPTCGAEIDRELAVIVPHTEKHIVEAIRARHPEWSGSDGVCKKCYEYLKKELHPEL